MYGKIYPFAQEVVLLFKINRASEVLHATRNRWYLL